MIKKLIGISLIFSFLLLATGSSLLIANAASLSAMSDTMSNQTVSAASSHIIKYTAATAVNGAGNTIVITFPAGFNFTSKTISSLTLTHGASTGTENAETLAAAPSATAWGAAFSGANNVILTLTAPTDGVGAAPLAANDKVIVTYNNTNSINPATPANYTLTINSNGDTGSITVPIITNSQVAVTATVTQTLTFSISNSSIGFGTLSPTATRYATSDSLGSTTEPTNAHNLTAGTNGASGYSIAISGPTLTSGANTIDPIPGPTAQPLVTGTEQFGIRATTAGGTGTVTPPFNGSAGNYGFGTSPLVSQTFATAPGATATTTYNVNYAANIAALTEAGSYSTTLTYVATANF